MTKTVLSVTPEMPLVIAATMLVQEDFSGLPVVDKNNILVGLLSQQDLMVGGSAIHLPTLAKLFKNFHLYKNDSEKISDEIKNLLSMRVKDVMDPNPVVIKAEEPVEQAIAVFKDTPRTTLLPVVDNDQKLCGVLARYDIIKLINAPSVTLPKNSEYFNLKLSENVKNFITDFGNQFVAVNKFRTHYWLLASVLFALIGFILAYVVILRINL